LASSQITFTLVQKVEIFLKFIHIIFAGFYLIFTNVMHFLPQNVFSAAVHPAVANVPAAVGKLVKGNGAPHSNPVKLHVVLNYPFKIS
jgi:hypothetical protein